MQLATTKMVAVSVFSLTKTLKSFINTGVPVSQMVHYLATTKNWSICGSLSWLSGSHTLVSSFSWTRLSVSSETKNSRIEFWESCLLKMCWLESTVVRFWWPANLQLACRESLPGIWSLHEFPPGLPTASSVLGQTPTSRRSSPGHKTSAHQLKGFGFVSHMQPVYVHRQMGRGYIDWRLNI